MKYLTLEEIKALNRQIPNPRQRLAILMGFNHGLRVSEVLGLTKENIKDGYVNVQRLKGSLKTVQPFVRNKDPELSEAEMLEELYGTLKPKERLFPWTRNGMHKLIQRAGKRAGIPEHKLHFHALKHSCAMVSIDKIGIQRVRTYLGHKSISSTGAYLVETDETASRAFAGAL